MKYSFIRLKYFTSLVYVPRNFILKFIKNTTVNMLWDKIFPFASHITLTFVIIVIFSMLNAQNSNNRTIIDAVIFTILVIINFIFKINVIANFHLHYLCNLIVTVLESGCYSIEELTLFHNLCNHNLSKV